MLGFNLDQLGDTVELLIVGFSQKYLWQSLDICANSNMSTSANSFFIGFSYQRRGNRCAPNLQFVAGLDLERIMDKDLGELTNARIWHGFRFPLISQR